MRASFEHIYDLAVAREDVPGDFAELGVWQGTTFLPLADLARTFGKTIHAVDSFQGCPAPTPRDFAPDGGCQFGKGALSVGGSKLFRDLMRHHHNVRIHEGWIPEILHDIPDDVRFAFVHLDLDQFDPTEAALAWLWPRMSPGGILVCHDWFDDREHLAAGAIRQWMAHTGVQPAGTLPSEHIWFRNGPSKAAEAAEAMTHRLFSRGPLA